MDKEHIAALPPRDVYRASTFIHTALEHRRVVGFSPSRYLILWYSSTYIYIVQQYAFNKTKELL